MTTVRPHDVLEYQASSFGASPRIRPLHLSHHLRLEVFRSPTSSFSSTAVRYTVEASGHDTPRPNGEDHPASGLFTSRRRRKAPSSRAESKNN